ncbi:MAG: aspartate 1-decarboxylase [Ectothiorhodospiraceae bacterium]|nr:aspartate 1-decarboxylase [Ectothiorhodospiraceae bacterium]
MKRIMYKSKIHRARVTEAELYYEGSLTVDPDLMKIADMLPFEKVQVVNINNGNRFETYLIEGEPGSGTICLNGAAARLGQVGDEVIIITYGEYSDEEAKVHEPTTVLVNEENKVKKITTGRNVA